MILIWLTALCIVTETWHKSCWTDLNKNRTYTLNINQIWDKSFEWPQNDSDNYKSNGTPYVSLVSSNTEWSPNDLEHKFKGIVFYMLIVSPNPNFHYQFAVSPVVFELLATVWTQYPPPQVTLNIRR